MPSAEEVEESEAKQQRTAEDAADAHDQADVPKGEKRSREPVKVLGRVRIKTGTGAAAPRKRHADGEQSVLAMFQEMENPTILPKTIDDTSDYDLAQVCLTHLSAGCDLTDLFQDMGTDIETTMKAAHGTVFQSNG